MISWIEGIWERTGWEERVARVEDREGGRM